MKDRRFQVIVNVEVPDHYDGDPEMEHAIVQRAIAAAAVVLRRAPVPRQTRGLEVKEVT